MAKSKRSICVTFKEVDSFTESMRWRFSHGQTEFKTYVGATLTLVIGCFLGLFMLLRFIKMVQRSESDIQSRLLYDFYDYSHQFSGFHFAFGVANSYGEQLTDDELMDYGQVYVYIDSWNTTSSTSDQISSRKCTYNDFGLADG